jgi:hypothetical protein
MVGFNLDNDNPTMNKLYGDKRSSLFCRNNYGEGKKILLSLTPPNSTILILVSRYPFSLYPPFPGLKANIFFFQKTRKNEELKKVGGSEAAAS